MRLNDDIQKLRENEIQIQNQERALRRLGEAIANASDSEDFGNLCTKISNLPFYRWFEDTLQQL